jgi:hypothetical protein
MTTNVLLQSVNAACCLKYRNIKKKKYKLNNQQMFERSKRNLKDSWNLTMNDKKHRTEKMNIETITIID